MQLSLHVFEYEGDQQVRTTDIEGEIWFYAVDVCKILEIKNPSDATSRLDNDEKTTIVLTDSGQPVRNLMINEYGLYSLILGSRKKSAKAFKRWITHEVLPSIRKKGEYQLPGFSHTPVFVRRYHDNWDRMLPKHFSIISELYLRVHTRLEQIGYTLPDIGSQGKEMRPDVSVGKLFPKWLEQNYPEHVNSYTMYNHKLPNGKEIEARQYERAVISAFIEYIDDSWLPEESYRYFSERDKKALPYLPKICPQLGAAISEEEHRFKNAIKKAMKKGCSSYIRK